MMEPLILRAASIVMSARPQMPNHKVARCMRLPCAWQHGMHDALHLEVSAHLLSLQSTKLR
jgi:hypothetical protein